jgi:hypothetical protein
VVCLSSDVEGRITTTSCTTGCVLCVVCVVCCVEQCKDEILLKCIAVHAQRLVFTSTTTANDCL